jgi:hypothetical protein
VVAVVVVHFIPCNSPSICTHTHTCIHTHTHTHAYIHTRTLSSPFFPQRTDQLLQDMIRRYFADKTVLTIAHRLETIMDSDRVLVLDGGRIAEFDDPFTLLQHRQEFHGMVMADGPDNGQRLVDIATRAVEARRAAAASAAAGDDGGHGAMVVEDVSQGKSGGE